MFAGGPFDVFDDPLARAFTGSSYLSHVPLLSGYDEPRKRSYQINLFGPIGADVRHYPKLLAEGTNRFIPREWLASEQYGIG